MKLLIGIIGEKGSGKGTFTKYFRKAAQTSPHLTIANTKSSDILAETLDLWHIPKTRLNLQHLAIIMDGQYGEGSLSNAVRERIAEYKEDIVIFEGIRWPTDIQMLRSFDHSLLIYVTAEPKTRYERLTHRNEKVGEAHATFEQFMQEERIATETQIVELSKQADIKIENNGSESDFESKVKEVFGEVLPSWFS